ncbi:hypothetical protein [Gloeocapsopsis dulcis]|uniref:Uncharacterized protein n=1 Tax=Gloeocapsopsis dulcis AAB1 = 1H9 TaxID=1433147 RepID=A0A6N8FY36_9CHRO|nr:hypothetical protein [Gloeocapsopsis dulcis]MUL38048.1 hypothetical protein [Gloeocapsopsis dulcis AAB1 = 1H9]WNN91737.1 hypothetical protein P0S91_11995 [Gloeocapsopsis dulcis]
MKDKLLNWLNTALVADFFLVLLSFFWLAIAVIGHTLHIPLGLDLWYKLWQPVFTPAIGILMAGSIISGLTSWIFKRLDSRQQLKN